ncbi:MAG TPA: hypothetical protein PLI56_05835, partial [Exilispira sp.]|nr:hypothetical protein [Exilispira sp.]
MSIFGSFLKKKKETIHTDEDMPAASSLKDLKKDQIKMINGIIELSHTLAHEIMKPRIDVVS